MILHSLKTNKFNNNKPELRDLFPNPPFNSVSVESRYIGITHYVNTATPLLWPEEKLGQAEYRFFYARMELYSKQAIMNKPNSSLV